MVRTCASCGQQNRVPTRHLADAGRCGLCKARFGPIAEPIDTGGVEFDEITREARVPVLVDFWAAWCGPCRMVAPEVKAVAHELSGKAIVLKVDTEQNPDLAARYGVRGIPNFAVFRGGKVVLQQSGAVDRRQLRQWLEQAS